jgi:D-alanyl-lipoteichoic acid acyltransferase DltB (MBOAT superfamily)
VSLTSASFLGFALLAITLLRIVPGGGWRQCTLLCLDAAFLYSQVDALLPLIPLVAFVLLGYVAVLIAAVWRAKYALGVLVLGLVVLFVWLKRYSAVSFVPSLGIAYTVVGLSYILFRILHIVIDVAQGSLQRPGFVTYLNYVMNFLCLLSGPIARLEDFSQQVRVRPPLLTWLEVDVAAQRILRGYVMVVVLAGVATNFVSLLQPEFSAALVKGDILQGMRVYALLTGAYLFNLYANFAGYMEIVIGIGLLAGLVLPENFHHPFLSKNFLDLWSRWHITLSNWLKFYLFNAVLKALGARFGTRSNMAYLGAVAFFVTFLVMGVWHGTTYVFFFYGLFLGAGVTINRLWQIWAPQWLSKDGWKSLQQRQWYFELSRAAALSYLALGLSSFWITDEQAAALVSSAGLAIVAGTYSTLLVVGTAAGFLWDGITALFKKLAPHDARGLLWITLVGVTLVSMVIAWGPLGLTGVLAASSRARQITVLALMAGAVAAILVSMGRIEGPVAGWRDVIFPRRRSDVAAIWLGFRAVLALNLCLLMATSIPEFIYKAF